MQKKQAIWAAFSLLIVLLAVAPVHAGLASGEVTAMQNIRTYIPGIASSWPDATLTSPLLCANGPGSTSISYATCGGGHIVALDFSTGSFTPNGTLGDISGLSYVTSLTLGGGVYDVDPWTVNTTNIKVFTITDPSNNPTPISSNITRWANLTTITVSQTNGYAMASLANLTKLTSARLSFSNSNIHSFPSDMFKNCGAITSLLISTGANGITALPDLSDMVKLQTLDLRYNNLTSLPDSFGSMTSLASILLDNNENLVRLAPSMKNCTSLISLTITSTKLVYQDSWFDMRQTRINSIVIDGLGLMSVLPDGFCQLSQNPFQGGLIPNVSLSITNTTLTSLPSCLGTQNPYLGYFSLSICDHLPAFPTLFSLPALQTLRLEYCPIASAFPSIPAIPSLVSVRVAYCSVPGAFPTSLFVNNPQLDRVDLSNNYLAGSIADFAFSNNSIMTRLTIDHNMLSGVFPSTICDGAIGSKQVNRIIANHNRFTSLPSVWTGCDSLGRFDFSDNYLESLPSDAAFSDLTALQSFLIGGNYNVKGDLPRFWTTSTTITAVNASSCSFHNNVPALNSNTLREVYLYDNRLNGSIEDPISASQLRTFKIDKNLLRGPIDGSALFTVPTNLVTLDISYNEFNGTLPSTIFSKLNKLISFSFNNNGFSGAVPDMTGSANLVLFAGQENFLDLCSANPNVRNTLNPSTCLLFNELFDYGSCNCTSWYTNCLTNSTCPAPGFVQAPYSIPPPPTPIMAPPPTLPVDPVAPAFSPSSSPSTTGGSGPHSAANSVAFSALVLLAALALWISQA